MHIYVECVYMYVCMNLYHACVRMYIFYMYVYVHTQYMFGIILHLQTHPSRTMQKIPEWKVLLQCKNDDYLCLVTLRVITLTFDTVP